jgi:hypothetical protein
LTTVKMSRQVGVVIGLVVLALMAVGLPNVRAEDVVTTDTVASADVADFPSIALLDEEEEEELDDQEDAEEEANDQDDMAEEQLAAFLEVAHSRLDQRMHQFRSVAASIARHHALNVAEGTEQDTEEVTEEESGEDENNEAEEEAADAAHPLPPPPTRSRPLSNKGDKTDIVVKGGKETSTNGNGPKAPTKIARNNNKKATNKPAPVQNMARACAQALPNRVNKYLDQDAVAKILGRTKLKKLDKPPAFASVQAAMETFSLNTRKVDWWEITGPGVVVARAHGLHDGDMLTKCAKKGGYPKGAYTTARCPVDQNEVWLGTAVKREWNKMTQCTKYTLAVGVILGVGVTGKQEEEDKTCLPGGQTQIWIAIPDGVDKRAYLEEKMTEMSGTTKPIKQSTGPIKGGNPKIGPVGTGLLWSSCGGTGTPVNVSGVGSGKPGSGGTSKKKGNKKHPKK